MPSVKFLPQNEVVEVESNTKILLAAKRAKVPLRYGCASCRCGTCGIRVSNPAALSDIADNEMKLLTRLKLNVDGTHRLACQARVMDGSVDVDLAFQDEYSPDVEEFE